VRVIDIDTPHGQARAHVHEVDTPRGVLVLGHGAAGGVGSRDLVAVTNAVLSERWAVVLVEQPYRVAGRRSPAPAHQLDTAWKAIVDHLRATDIGGLPLVAGGRSAGARVACRTASETGAVGVVCLAFPLQPPPRRSREASPSRLPELDAVAVPVLVVQGERDRFGIPPPATRRTLVRVRGDHSLRTDLDSVARAVGAWLDDLFA
jgi:uncharacterized protein